MDREGQIKRHLYLKKFPDVDDLNAMNFEAGSDIGEEIVGLLKQKGLTYQEAYMSLQYAYNKLHYETNLLQLK